MKFIIVIVVVVVSEVFIIPRPASTLGIIALPAKPVLNCTAPQMRTLWLPFTSFLQIGMQCFFTQQK